MYCKQCNYNLRGVASHQCPECGCAFDSADPRTWLKSVPLSQTYFIVAGTFIAGVFVASWTYSFVQVINDDMIDMDLGVAPSSMGLVSQLLWSLFGAIVPTCLACFCALIGRAFWRQRPTSNE